MASFNPSTLMQAAMAEARVALAKGEVPIGAVIADASGQIMTRAHNLVEAQQNPLQHAEMLCLHEALTQVGDKFLSGCTLAVTLEPCPMCMAALAHARVARVVFGAYDPKSGGTVSGPRVASFMHHKPEILGGIEEAACAELLTGFFQGLRG
jgi:tRNA(Arg) A34 adenosine deaminase TadA